VASNVCEALIQGVRRRSVRRRVPARVQRRGGHRGVHLRAVLTVCGQGEAVQVEAIKPTLKAPGTKRLKLTCDQPLSVLLQFCFQF
jgi:hypothetical protein